MLDASQYLVYNACMETRRKTVRTAVQNACPLCGGMKTAWSARCQTCFIDGIRAESAATHADSDREILAAVQARGQSAVARERGVTRQAVSLMVAKARTRLASVN